MGNKQGKQSNGQIRGDESRPMSTPLHPPPVSPAAFETFLGTLANFPFTLTEEQFETIIYDVAERKFSPGSIIVENGQPPSALFVVTEGKCKVLASNGKCVIRYLRKSDFFGEISCFYSNPCTCSVLCGDESACNVIYLAYDKIQFLIRNTELMPMKDWFVGQKYIDTDCIYPNGEISALVVKHSMTLTPIFGDWSADAISSVYKKMLPTPIKIYSPSEIIFFPDDEMPCGYLLIMGEIEIFGNDISVTISSEYESIWFGDQQLFCSTRKSLTAKALSICQIVVFTPDLFATVLSEFTSELHQLMQSRNYWKQFQDMSDLIVGNNCELMDASFLTHTLKMSPIFNYTELRFLYYIALGTIFKSIDEDEIILENCRSNEPSIIIILAGCAALIDPSSDSLRKKLQPKSTFYFDKTASEKSLIKATGKTLVGFISKSLVENTKNIYAEALVNINW